MITGISWDEMHDAGGAVRPHWQVLDRALAAFGPGAMWRRWEEARQLIRRHGVTYNVYGDPRGLERPWPLDPVPLVLAAEEQARLADGLAQRATLLDRLIADLYGRRRVITDGLLPPELLFSHPGLLRGCAGLSPPGGRFLHLYAADLVRTPDGAVRVLADRTQAPAGAGYALENRIVLGRVLTETFRACRVQRLAPFFRTLRETLAALAPGGRGDARIVLLTAGTHNATYFEQAFLAQYLGIPLVEGGDLSVWDGRLFLKTLGGLHPVDVVLRRLNDDYCDPLELRPESLLGVPGLLQVARDGNVAIANALGSGVGQAAGLFPYLPGLCRALLGEELRLPSVETHWCGEREGLWQVTEHLEEMVVKPAHAVGRTEPIFGSRLSAEERGALAARLRAEPGKFVGQRRVAPSVAPVIEGDELRSRPLVLRSFAVAKGLAGYEVMPGGLALVGGDSDDVEVSIARGARSKDTWVPSEGVVNEFSMLRPAGQPVPLVRGGGDLPSRVADNFFWLGRYAERAESIARLARTICLRLADRGRRSFASELIPLLVALETQTQVASGNAPEAASRGDEGVEPERRLRAALFEPAQGGSLASTVRAIDRVARSIRDRLSMDSWSVVVTLQYEVGRPEPSVWEEPLLVIGSRLDHAIASLSALAGFVSESLTREDAWRFLEMGRRLERALNTALVIDRALSAPHPDEGALFEAVLEAADSAMTYRRRYRSTLQVAPVVDLLLGDDRNPRAIVFQLAALADQVAALPRQEGFGGGADPGPERQIVFSLLTDCRQADVAALCRVEGDRRPALRALASRVVLELQSLSDALSGSYLTPVTISRSLAGQGIAL